MILFDSAFTSSISELLGDPPVLHVSRQLNFSKFLSRKSARNYHLAYAIKSLDTASETKEYIANKQLIVKNLAQKVFNALWQQKIFLSISDKRIDKYVDQLNSLGIYDHKNAHKYLVAQFSKSLFSQSLVSSVSGQNDSSVSFFFPIQYPWSKVFCKNFSNLFSLISKDSYHNNYRPIYNSLKDLRMLCHYPLFIVSNNLGQMVISESPEGLNLKRTFIDNFSFAVDNSFSRKAWFFVNHEDAKEYMHYINIHYGLKENTLKIFTCSLHNFYRLSFRFGDKIEFRLIPDLKEIAQLIRVYKYRKNFSFHSGQSYGKNFFQGQPLYMVKDEDGHIYSNPSQKNSKKFSFVFTSYEAASDILQKHKKSLRDTKSSRRLSLVAYNLESFIKDRVRSTVLEKDSFLLIPSRSSYLFAKESQLRRNSFLPHKSFFEYMSFAKLWSKRILWSLTSRHPKG